MKKKQKTFETVKGKLLFIKIDPLHNEGFTPLNDTIFVQPVMISIQETTTARIGETIIKDGMLFTASIADADDVVPLILASPFQFSKEDIGRMITGAYRHGDEFYIEVKDEHIKLTNNYVTIYKNKKQHEKDGKKTSKEGNGSINPSED